MSSSMQVLLSQLAGQSPVLLVYLGGIVLTVMLWSRASRAAMLALTGLVLLLFSAVASAMLTAYIIANRPSPPQMSSLLMVSGIGFSLIRAMGMALIIAAVFAQRPREPLRGFEVTVQ